MTTVEIENTTGYGVYIIEFLNDETSQTHYRVTHTGDDLPDNLRFMEEDYGEDQRDMLLKDLLITAPQFNEYKEAEVYAWQLYDMIDRCSQGVRRLGPFSDIF